MGLSRLVGFRRGRRAVCPTHVTRSALALPCGPPEIWLLRRHPVRAGRAVARPLGEPEPVVRVRGAPCPISWQRDCPTRRRPASSDARSTRRTPAATRSCSASALGELMANEFYRRAVRHMHRIVAPPRTPAINRSSCRTTWQLRYQQHLADAGCTIYVTRDAGAWTTKIWASRCVDACRGGPVVGVWLLAAAGVGDLGSRTVNAHLAVKRRSRSSERIKMPLATSAQRALTRKCSHASYLHVETAGRIRANRCAVWWRGPSG
jgi:hypothetical protein